MLNSAQFLRGRNCLLLWSGTRTLYLRVSLFPSLLISVDHVSCTSGFNPWYRSIFDHCISCPRNWNDLGFWLLLVTLTKSRAMFFEMLISILQSRTQSHFYRNRPPSNRWERWSEANDYVVMSSVYCAVSTCLKAYEFPLQTEVYRENVSSVNRHNPPLLTSVLWIAIYEWICLGGGNSC
jgi:hypothetical protein